MSVALLLALVLSAARADTPVEDLPEPLRARYLAGEAAWEGGDLAAAETAFVDVTREAPGFDRAWRRLCGVVLAADRPDDALPSCQRAQGLVDSLENRTALAIALLETDAVDKARPIVKGVIQEAPDYLPGQVAHCAWARAMNDDEALAACAAQLERLSPGTPGTLYYKALDLSAKGRTDEAADALRVASELGLTDDLLRDGALGVARRVQADEAAGGRKARAGRGDEAAWSWSDLLPLGLGAALVLAVGVLAFGKDEDAPGDGAGGGNAPSA